jgi:phosphoribosyl 1,2-cyclic phosphodiesterase
MSLSFSSLNSGSNGNCYYIGNATGAVLIDAGISCRETEKRMLALGLSLKTVKAIFISHEHTDHIKGVATLSAKYSIPVYITNKTAHYCAGLKSNLCHHFEEGQMITAGQLSITPFTKCHDGCDPHSFVVNYEGLTVGIFTDIGKVCENLIYYFKKCDAAFLESNYDEQMLDTGPYPLVLKRRIRGGHGHLSNTQALELFIRHRPKKMTHLLLSHLSRENNHPEIVEKTFSPYAGSTKIFVASRYQASPLFSISTSSIPAVNQHARQLQLF